MNVYEAIAAAGTGGTVSSKNTVSYLTEEGLMQILPGHFDVDSLCIILASCDRRWIAPTGWEVVSKGESK